MRQALVFGASGQLGAAVLARLLDAGWHACAVSRTARVGAPGVRWLRGDLAAGNLAPGASGLPSFDAIFSCGPLDHFARWYGETTIDAPRVVAFGSTSIDIKADSADAAERDVARRLAEGERGVFAAARARGTNATLLRPTLVYGAGRDRTLTRIVGVSRRWGRFVLPRHACGLRQPVHLDDLAAAALQACDASATYGRAYALPGGETLPYREMVVRVLAALEPPPVLHEVPAPLFAAALQCARALGHVGGFGEAAVARLRRDLVFDADPARRDFGYAPRPFRPTTAMFSACCDEAGMLPP